MIYLYRFDIFSRDPIFGDFSAFNTQAPNSYSEPVCLTNYERPLSVVDSAVFPPSAPGFLRPLTDTRTFTPEVISHSGLVADQEQGAGQLKVCLPVQSVLAQLYALDFPHKQVMLSVVEKESPEGAPRFIWIGYLGAPEFSNGIATFTAYPLSEVFERSIVGGKHSRTCPHQLFDARSCALNPNADGITYFAFREDGIATSYNAGTLALIVPEAANRPDGFFDNGFVLLRSADDALPVLRASGTYNPFVDALRSNLPSDGIKRQIHTHKGSVLTLATPLLRPLRSNQVVVLLAGCDKQKATCKDKFNNKRRFGGYPYIPIKNVYETGLKTLDGK